MRKLMFVSLLSLSGILSMTLTSCAADSATAAYAVKAQTADGLSSTAENHIVQRAKMETMRELGYISPSMCAPVSCQ